MRLSAAIMAHPVRRRYAERLQTKLGRDVPIVYDTNPVPSADPEQRWQTGRRAWLAHDPDADWHLVIQDDALVCRDLIDGLEKALEQLGTTGLVSAYTGTGRPDQHNVTRALARAQAGGYAWTSTRSLNWGPAIIAPTHTIAAMLAWCDHPRRRTRNFDHRVGMYYRDVLRWRTWYTVPSLVDHAGIPSLVGHDLGPKRVAHQFHGTRSSALTVDWTATPPDFSPLLPN